MGFFDFLPEIDRYAEDPKTVTRMNLRHDRIIAPVAGRIAGKRVLDLAAHDGRWSYAFAAAGAREVVGIELSSEAIASACRSRDELQLAHVTFHADDATAFAQSARTLPPLVVVNPPRRGIGSALCQRLRESDVRHIVYSSCNAASLARDIAELADFQPREARLFDMFPHTHHYEVACLLERRETATP